jgi:hypothetical protein
VSRKYTISPTARRRRYFFQGFAGAWIMGMPLVALCYTKFFAGDPQLNIPASVYFLGLAVPLLVVDSLDRLYVYLAYKKPFAKGATKHIRKIASIAGAYALRVDTVDMVDWNQEYNVILKDDKNNALDCRFVFSSKKQPLNYIRVLSPQEMLSESFSKFIKDCPLVRKQEA